MSSPNDRVLDAGLPTLRSFVASANDSLGDFPIQNLPFGMVDEQVAVRIGDMVLTLSDALDSGALDLDAIAGGDRDACIEVEIAIVHGENVGDIAVLPALVRSRLRGHLAWLLAEDSPERARLERVLRP